MFDKKAFWLAVLVVAGTFSTFVVSALLLTRHWPSAIWTHRFSLEELGSIGDSFAPITAMFAVAAAVFSILAYFRQVQALSAQAQLEVEQRENDARVRFDGLFFRAVEEYDRAFTRLDKAARTGSRGATGQLLLKELRAMRERGDVAPEGTERIFWIEQLVDDRYQPVQRFMNSVFAIVLWLDDAAKQGVSLDRWMKLFEDRMSGPEQNMLVEFIEFLAPMEIHEATQRLRLFEKARASLCVRR